VKDSGPNWGLAFGSASFLIVWMLGFLTGLSVEVIALRACVATMLGSLVGLLFGQVIAGIKAVKDDPTKGTKVDFTVAADDDDLDELLKSPVPAPGERTATVPQTSPAPGLSAPSANTAEAFQPLDFKQAARQIQNTMKE
jgi:hypothetical protein